MKRVLLSFAALLASTTWARADLIYVDANASSGGDGTSWATAFDDLQDALDASVAEDEIWVAAGTYKPTTQTDPNDTRSATFSLLDRRIMYGGFQGQSHPSGGETQRSQRQPEVYFTILSGDIGTSSDPTDNAYHVVTADFVGSETILNGFVIRDGYAFDGSPQGAGMYISGITQSRPGPVVARCSFLENSADSTGSAVFVATPDSESTLGPQFLACRFEGNSNTYRGTVYIDPDSTVTLINCLAYGNVAGSAPFLFTNSSNLIMVNCTVVKNFHTVSQEQGEEPKGAILLGGGTAWISNSMLWSNYHPVGGGEAAQLSVQGSVHYDVRYCNIDGLDTFAGNGNIDIDPTFADMPNDDFRLAYLSHALNNGDSADVPADIYDIDDDGDTSEPLPDLDMNDRQINPDTCVDIGCFENQVMEICLGDITDSSGGGPDGVVDTWDLRLVNARWGMPGGVADLAPVSCGNSVVDVDDQVVVLTSWGSCGEGLTGGGGLSTEEAVELLYEMLEEDPEHEEAILALLDYLDEQ